MAEPAGQRPIVLAQRQCAECRGTGYIQLLTVREREVLRLTALGLTQREIGAQLCVSVKTVKSHMAAVYDKFGALSVAHAVAIGISGGLIDRLPVEVRQPYHLRRGDFTDVGAGKERSDDGTTAGR